MILEDLAEQLGIELPEGPYETVGGFVLDRIGRVAVVGDSVLVGDHLLRVAETDRYRISRLTLVPQPASEPSLPTAPAA